MFPSLQRRISRVLLAMGLLGLSLAVVACAATRQTRGVKPQGFLGDYSELRKGEGDEAQLVYINPDVPWRRYTAIMIDSVTIWRESKTAKLSAEDQQMLTDFFYKALQEELSQDYEIVDSPGPGVMRLRAAITEAKGARVVGNAVTSIIPQLRILTTVGGIATNTQVFVGKATVEAEILDSLTHERLAAAVDERAGTKALRVGLKEWSQVKRIFEVWAERLRKRLAELRAS